MKQKSPFLYIEDVKVIFGCCGRTARKRISKAHERIGLPDETFISIQGFCKAYDLSEKRIEAILRGEAEQLSREYAT
ncbi:hypothetical protein [Paucihalobacter sp.]|uniref:hypothetical protein n=1 Tax=Paucihalobacter sp. TaxID=2850405 RepID=UPI002FE12958